MIKIFATLSTVIQVKVTIQEVNHFRRIDILHIDPLVSDHLQFHEHVTKLVLDIVIVISNSTAIEILHAQDTLLFTNSEENLDSLFILLQKKLVLFFPDLTVEIFSISEVLLIISTFQTTFKIYVCI